MVKAITVIVVIKEALGYGQQFFCNTATTRHPSRSAHPSTALCPEKLLRQEQVPRLCHGLKTGSKPSGEPEGAAEVLCQLPPFLSDPVSHKLPLNASIPLKASRQR